MTTKKIMSNEDNIKAPIKPSLHSMSEQLISSKVLQNQKNNDQKSSNQLIPFKALSKLMTSCHSNATSSSSGPQIQITNHKDFDRNVHSNRNVNEFQKNLNKIFTYNCDGDYHHNSSRMLSLSSYDMIGSICNSSDQMKTSLNPNFGRPRRLYNSCPSSPVLKRVHQKQTQSSCPTKRRELIFSVSHGSDVILSPDLTTASRREDKQNGSNCYVFIGQNFSPEMIITIEIVALDQINSKQSFVFGVTDVNPSAIDATLLPTDPNSLISKTDQLWIMIDNFCDQIRPNDKIRFSIDSKGFVYFDINFQPKSILFPILNTCRNRKLWPFFNIIGPIKTIKLIGDLDKHVIKNNFNLKTERHLYKCLNCWSNAANTAFYRCGHKYYCFPCAQLLVSSSKICPFCGTKIIDLLIVFP